MKKIRLTWLLICVLATISFAQPGLPLETELEEHSSAAPLIPHQLTSWPSLATPMTNTTQEIKAQDLQLPHFFDPPEPANNTLRTLVPYAISAMTPLGLFCQMELQIQKRANFPIRVRLGEVDYTERLEYGEHFRLDQTDYAPRVSD